MTVQADVPARERVLNELRQRLDTGAYAQGVQLPPERELARELSVSRTVLRRALAVLESEGRVWRGVGQGTFAGPPAVERPESVPDIDGLTSPAEVMEVRLALEPELARFAAHRASNRELDEMQRFAERAALARTQGTYERWDGRLHHAVAAAAHNRLFLTLFEALNAVRTHTGWGRAREARRSHAWQERTRRQHAALVEALRRRHADLAEARMRAHLEAVRDRLLGGAQRSDPSPD